MRRGKLIRMLLIGFLIVVISPDSLAQFLFNQSHNPRIHREDKEENTQSEVILPKESPNFEDWPLLVKN